MRDVELVKRVRLGERDAFGILIERYRARVLGLVAAMLGDSAEAEDVVQEAMYQAYFGIGRLRDASRFGPWLFGIAVNLAKMALRRRRLMFTLEDLDGGRVVHEFDLRDATPEAEYEVRELRESVRQAIAQLPQDMRAAVWMHYVEGLSYKEIGAMFDIAPGTLRVQTHRARQKLRQSLVEQWSRPVAKKETKMIEVTVEDILLLLPKDWSAQKPQDVMVGTKDKAPSSPFPPAKRYVVLLKERDGKRMLPIWVGSHEGISLIVHLAQMSLPRPLTVDFYARVFDVVGVEVERVAITELRDETFISTVTLRATGQTHDLDARPSDALNLAARQDAPMFVSTEVMQKVGFSGVEPATWLEEDAAKEGRPIEAGLGWRSGLELAPDIFN